MTTPQKSKLPTFRLGYVAIPFAAAAGFAATALVVMNDLRENDAISAHMSVQSISEIEFMSQPEATTFSDAIEGACAATGCDASRTATLINSGIGAMTDQELEGALRAQATTLGDLTVQIDLAGDTTASNDLRAQYLAEAEITSLYRAELRKRLRTN